MEMGLRRMACPKKTRKKQRSPQPCRRTLLLERSSYRIPQGCACVVRVRACLLARGFQSRIEIVKDGQRVSTDALEIVLLAAECGSQLVLEATGPDAEEALDALMKLFADNFGLTA